jgi:hypothetical protein
MPLLHTGHEFTTIFGRNLVAEITPRFVAELRERITARYGPWNG